MGTSLVGLIANLNTVYSNLLDAALKAVSGFTDGLNCDGSGNYPVSFNKPVTFTDHTGVTFVKNQGLAGEETLLATSLTASPASTITYSTPVWIAPLVAGDTVHFDIGAGSNYISAEGDLILQQTILITNCLDVVSNFLQLNNNTNLQLNNNTDLELNT